MIPRVEATIDLDALSHNFAVIKTLVGSDVRIMPMVKANAYGHGLIEVAHHLAQADAFGVATLPEAFKLRNSGIDQDIFVMCGYRNADELALFSKLNLTAVVHHQDQIGWLLQAKLHKPITVWLKVDTGMHRLGIHPDTFAATLTQLQSSKNIKQPFGIMTHLANADADSAFTCQQLQLFNELTGHLDHPKSVANSAAIIAFKDSHYQLVRPGIMLYGVSPFAGKTGGDLGLKPVMTFSSSLVAYKDIAQGSYVGYGCHWQAERDLMIGIVSAGYGDGYPRHAINLTPVLVNGVRCPIVGRVSMDMLAVDLSSVDHPKIGDPVILWGQGLPVECVAESADTIAHELFCRLTGRVAKNIV